MFIAKAIIFLFAILLISCSKDKEPNLDCGSFCDDEKIKAWYQQKYGEPITEFEFSAKSVLYETSDGTYIGRGVGAKLIPHCVISAVKKANVAIAKCDGKRIEIGMEEWLHFIRELSRLRIYEWEEQFLCETGCYDRYCEEYWNVEIVYSYKDKPLKYCGNKVYPENWEEFERTINEMNETISEKASRDKEILAVNKAKAENILSAKYKKRFGEPITQFELLAKEIEFYFHNKDFRYFYFRIFRDLEKTNANAEVFLQTKLKAELSTEEWLDFIRALYKNRFYLWAEEYGWKEKYKNKKISPDLKWRRKHGDDPSKSSDYESLYSIGYPDLEWLRIHKNFKLATYKRLYSVEKPYPPNWAEFKKIIHEMETKIEEKFLIKKREVESILSAEYQKKFGELITEYELSTTNMNFWFKADEYNHYKVIIDRDITKTNAKAEFSSLSTNAIPFRKSFYDRIYLSMDEWLDFVRALYKTRFYEWKEWKKNYGDDKKYDGFEWELDVSNNNIENFPSFSGINAYPPNWDEFKKLMDDMEEKIKMGY